METRRIQVGCDFTYAAAVPTPVIFQVTPAGRGRDASDVAMATTFGGPQLESMLVQAEEAP